MNVSTSTCAADACCAGSLSMWKGDFGGNTVLDVWVTDFAASQLPCTQWSPQHTLIAKDHPGLRSK